MANRYKDNESEENPFAMSIGDLMAGLLFIFILLLTATMLKVQTKSDQDAAITQEYDRVKTQKGYKSGAILQIDKTALRKELEKAGVVRSLSSGF